MSRSDEAFAALAAVVDPELDEPVTDLGFVRSLLVSPSGDVELHLRLPTSFCSPNFAYLMASDAKDVLVALTWARHVVVELDDHHDSAIINAGLAADAGYRGTFGHEAEDSLDELRQTFTRKAHTAAMERCLTALLRSDRARSEESLGRVTLGELPDDELTASLLRRREALGLSTCGTEAVLVDHLGHRYDDVPMAIRRARSTRISIDGNAHFCRGLLRTRYADEPAAFFPASALLPDHQGVH
ncbi:iron-sulfur cluster assembly protein [Mycobacterium sp. ITM-2016-00317]|uniref:iron-sulfur cluster assembly protein n=1 Tax=Mycobacterium sp. ITM-2016-00317 TaxID=2099694 RepID=UPI000D4573CB|nr:iron-sulfur cluster assembly protein [Mycobacterium sp. ITM-2016-00317]WNG86105.1 iron-sulfur cluster assembly protein [Mycobacterium sp. ITM-2016-00317]